MKYSSIIAFNSVAGIISLLEVERILQILVLVVSFLISVIKAYQMLRISIKKQVVEIEEIKNELK